MLHLSFSSQLVYTGAGQKVNGNQVEIKYYLPRLPSTIRLAFSEKME